MASIQNYEICYSNCPPQLPYHLPSPPKVMPSPPPHELKPPFPPHHFTPPPPHHVNPPPSPHHSTPPPPHHANLPPPPHHMTPPPPPHHMTPPPPPHVKPPPPPSPKPHPAVIIIIVVSLGGLFFLALISVAMCCYINKKRRVIQETDIVKMDEHVKVKEAIVQGPNGPQAVVLSIDEDVHFQEVVQKHKKSVGKHHHSHALENAHSTSERSS